MTDLVIRNARCVATLDDARRELAGGWVAITDGLVEAVGSGDAPAAASVIDATDCLVTPGLINTHHHIYQNLTRAYPPMTDKPLFGWLQSLYPLWAAIDTESVYVSTWVGLAELALSGCTTSTDHLYLHPHGAGDLLTAEIEAARDLGIRFHPTRGSMSLSVKDGGLPPDDVVSDDDSILAASEEAVRRHHDRSWGAMTRVALAPCSPFSVTEELMVRTAELAERLDVRLHTHFAENAEDDEFSLATFGCRPMEYLERTGWASDRTWVAHCVMPNPDEVRRLGAAGRRGGPLPVEQPDPRIGHLARWSTCERPACRSGSASTGRRRPTRRRCGWRPARRCCSPSSATGRTPARHGWRSRSRPSAVPPASAAPASSACSHPVPSPTWRCGRSPARRSPARSPTRSRRWLRCGPASARDTIVHGLPIVRDGRIVAESTARRDAPRARPPRPPHPAARLIAARTGGGRRGWHR